MMQGLMWASLAVWAVCVAGLFYSLVEYDAARQMKPWPFRIGPIVLRQSFLPGVVRSLPGDQGVSGAVNYRWLTKDTVLVRLKSGLPRPLAVLGTLEVTGDQVWLTCRAPVGVLWFAASWLGGWVLFGVQGFVTSRDWFFGELVGGAVLLGFGFFGLALLWNRYDRRRLARELLALEQQA